MKIVLQVRINGWMVGVMIGDQVIPLIDMKLPGMSANIPEKTLRVALEEGLTFAHDVPMGLEPLIEQLKGIAARMKAPTTDGTGKVMN